MEGHPGNELCWGSPNWLGLDLSFERCCTHTDGDIDCFQPLQGMYTHDFCCYPLDDDCPWDEQRGHWEHHYLQSVAVFPLVVRELQCAGSSEVVFADLFRPGSESSAEDLIPEEFKKCCLSVLRRKLWATADADPPWLQAELDREFAPLRGRTWNMRYLGSFGSHAWRADASGRAAWLESDQVLRPCLLRIREGYRVSVAEDLEACGCGLTRVDGAVVADPSNDCSYIQTLRVALMLIGSVRPLPDTDMFVSSSNTERWETLLPVFTRVRPRNPRSLYVLLPYEWLLHPFQNERTRASSRHLGKYPWHRRQASVVWRGSNSNCIPSCSMVKAARDPEEFGSCLRGYACEDAWNASNWLNTPRGRLVYLSQFVHGLDARFTSASRKVADTLWESLVANGLTAPYMPLTEQMRHRFTINLDGTGAADRLYAHFMCGFAVLACESAFAQWLTVDAAGGENASLRPFEHFVPVRYDLSDLAGRIAWLRANDEEAELIARRGYVFAARHLTLESALLYVDRAVRRFKSDHLHGD